MTILRNVLRFKLTDEVYMYHNTVSLGKIMSAIFV